MPKPAEAPVRLIVNADDLGWSDGVTAGILRAHREGIVTSATLAANMPAAAEAIDAAAEAGDLGVGVHLNACQGPALSQAGRRELAAHAGRMDATASRLVRAIVLRPRRVLPAVEAEFAAQIEFCLERGLRPTHVDSHRHAHAWPSVFRLVRRLCERYDIPWIRRHRERPAWLGGFWGRAPARQRRTSRQLNLLGAVCRRLGRERLATEGTIGVAHTGRLRPELLCEALGRVGPGATEIMAHPGYAEGLSAGQTRLLADREKEMDALCDPRPRRVLDGRGIELIHYGRLHPAP